MSIEYFISRVGRYLSIFAFILVLLFTYRGLPDPAAVHFGANGRGDGFLPKKLTLQHMSVATSGDVYQFIENRGKK